MKVHRFRCTFSLAAYRGDLRDLWVSDAKNPMFHHKLLDGRTWAKVWKMWPKYGICLSGGKWDGRSSISARGGVSRMTPAFLEFDGAIKNPTSQKRDPFDRLRASCGAPGLVAGLAAGGGDVVAVAYDDRASDEEGEACGDEGFGAEAGALPFLEDDAPEGGEEDDRGHVQGP